MKQLGFAQNGLEVLPKMLNALSNALVRKGSKLFNEPFYIALDERHVMQEIAEEQLYTLQRE
jgi:hypothetical protein